jgi:hypothetical protein
MGHRTQVAILEVGRPPPKERRGGPTINQTAARASQFHSGHFPSADSPRTDQSAHSSEDSGVLLIPDKAVTTAGYICAMAVVGDLIRRADGGAMVQPPQYCPHGHALGPGKCLSDTSRSIARQRGGHLTWECLACCAVVYAPPFMADCQPLGAPQRCDD